MSRLEIMVCAIAAAVTLLIRALPFLISDLNPRKVRSDFVERLGKLLTPALIGMLVIYCLKDIRFSDPSTAAASIALAVCVASYVWKRNTLVSIVVPTIIYMVLIRVL